jgi:hypothetical protein
MRHPKILLLVVLAAATAAIAISPAAAPDRAQLVARAIPSANTFSLEAWLRTVLA